MDEIPSLQELEANFDSHLAIPRVTNGAAAALQLAAARWSDEIWKRADNLGPLNLAESNIARGQELAQFPVFICGAHRSGTTLIRDLMDAHPALSVLPSEGTFYTNLERRLRRLPPGRWQQFMGCEWLRRLANPIHQQPYWLLGRSDGEHSPYIDFARLLMSWWPIAQEALGSSATSWPLVAVALAYAQTTNCLSEVSSARWWVEKTPTNERFLDRIRSEFSNARVIHVIRNPYDVFASHAQALRSVGERFARAGHVLSDLKLGYNIAATQARKSEARTYLLLRYEDVVADPGQTSRVIADFLQIEALPILTRPTAAGILTISNSSFTSGAQAGRVALVEESRRSGLLSRAERELVTAVVGESAAQHGYELAPIPLWRARLIRATAPITSRLA